MEEPPLEHWDMVIKVKYGDSLRRIGAYVHGQLMDHNMNKLRTKIINLFKFSPDAEFILTYIDEDGDVVTLDDDDELRDAVISQHLNPLRINVQLKSDTGRNSDVRPEEGNPAPANCPQIETQPLDQIRSAVDGALKSVPNPVRSALLNISNDVVKAAASAPALAQLVEHFMALSNANQPSYGTNRESSGGSSGVSTHPVDPNANHETKDSNIPISEATVLPNITTIPVFPVSSTPVPCTTTIPAVPALRQEIGNTTQGGGATAWAPVDLNMDIPRNPNASMYPFDDLLDSWSHDELLDLEKECSNTNDDGKSVAGAALPYFPPAPQTVGQYSQNPGTSKQPPIYVDGNADIIGGDGTNKQLPMDTRNKIGSDSQGDLPVNSHDDAARSWGPMMHPYRRSHYYHESSARTFHRGVQCDGCGMHPIVGSRFKSNVKEDYDLCNICFNQMGNEADYTRIDRATYRSPKLFKSLSNSHARYRLPSSNVFHGCGVRPPRAKLESRFIQDVTVLDGTLMPPSTQFTKIWRMHNNGTVAWPLGTQLVWCGGDKLGDRTSADMEIPVNGLPVNAELDVAVDFTAPSLAGRYVSYWRMASPSGQKFGQRVWVLIQVDYSPTNSVSGGSFHPELNLNLPPESSARNGLGIIDVDAEPLKEEFPEPRGTNTTDELVKPLVDVVPSGVVEQSAQVVVDDSPSAGDGGLSQETPTAPSPSASYTLIDFPTASLEVAADTKFNVDDNTVEQTLLKELEAMGFKEIDLNKEILRQNQYDLEQSVDDLCGFAEWDPLLSELAEMGFADKELNKKLLIKNGGSIKRAVLDLIAGEKGE